MSVAAIIFVATMVAIGLGGVVMAAISAIRGLRRWIARSPQRHSDATTRATLRRRRRVDLGALCWRASVAGDRERLVPDLDEAYWAAREGDIDAVQRGQLVGDDYVAWFTAIDLGWAEFRNVYGAEGS